MKFVSRAFFVVAVIGVILAQPMMAQQYSKISDSEQPPASMKYVPLHEYLKAQETVPQSPNFHPPLAPPQLPNGQRALAGIMINAYSSQSTLTNQLGYDYVNNVATVIFRAGPSEQYPNAGNGSLVLNTTANGGESWSGNSDIFNEDLPGNIQGQELSARHPNIYSMNVGGTTHIASTWSSIYATFLTPTGVLGEVAHKAGPLAGPYQGGVLDKTSMLQYFPTRMVASQSGTLFSVFQSINPDQDELTGEYYLMKSTDNGITWTVSAQPVLRESDLEDGYQMFYSATTLDVSPDGTTLYIGFLGIFVEDGSFTFTENRFGYTRSTDGGATWSAPVMYPLYDWDFGNTPINSLEGWMLPSIAVAVDGQNKPHFLMSVNGQDTFYPLDSMLIGEITVNPDDQTEVPKFFALAQNILPDFRRKINPRGAASGAQPTFSIWAEHEWSKSPDGMKLIAKWIDADSLFVTTPAGHAQPYVRDSTHDIFILEKDIANAGNTNQGWKTVTVNVGGQDVEVFDIQNVTQSVGTDEKFTKMNPIYDPGTNNVFFLYTIMATGEFVVGQIYPDTDDTGPSELYFVPFNIPVGINDRPDAMPEGFTLSQNFPNPFNPTTTIRFSVHAAGNVKIKVLNMLGQEMATAFEGFVEPGVQTVSFNAKDLPSGQYMYRLESNGYTLARIMTLMK